MEEVQGACLLEWLGWIRMKEVIDKTILKDTEWKRLDELAKKKHLSISSLVRSLICEILGKIKEGDSNGNSARD